MQKLHKPLNRLSILLIVASSLVILAFFLLVDGLVPPKVASDAKIELEEGDEDAESENGADDVKKTAAVEISQVLDQNLVEKEKKSG